MTSSCDVFSAPPPPPDQEVSCDDQVSNCLGHDLASFTDSLADVKVVCPWVTHYSLWRHQMEIRHWPFVRGIHRSPVNSPHKGQWRRALVFSLICAWISGWVNNREAGDLRRHRAHYDITVIYNFDEFWSMDNVSNHTSSKLWDEITYTFLIFDGETVVVWEWLLVTGLPSQLTDNAEVASFVANLNRGSFHRRFLFVIQIWWKLRFAVIPVLAIRSQQMFAHATTAQLSCRVQIW